MEEENHLQYHLSGMDGFIRLEKIHHIHHRILQITDLIPLEPQIDSCHTQQQNLLIKNCCVRKKKKIYVQKIIIINNKNILNILKSGSFLVSQFR